jgi:hypothetical protein
MNLTLLPVGPTRILDELYGKDKVRHGAACPRCFVALALTGTCGNCD